MPRHIALNILNEVLERNRPLDKVLQQHRRLASLETRDRNFVRHLVSTTLRRLGQIDDLIYRCLDRPLPKGVPKIHQVLRLGTCQLLFIGTPAYAVVSTSVDLISHGTDRAFSKLVNAVLRRLSREGSIWLTEQDVAQLNTPRWLWDAWGKVYGYDTRRKIAEAHLTEPPLDLTVAAKPKFWAKKLRARLLPTGSLRCDAPGIVPHLPGFNKGAWWVQDASAALPARLLGNVANRRVLDLCAAPGGKTAQLAAAGAKVTALDRSAQRLQRLEKNLSRLGLQANIVIADATTWKTDALFDAVLLDAPCSATGTLRRHPDIMYLKTPENVNTLATVQAAMLDNAIRLVTPGGILIYCVCSLQPEEGTAQVTRNLPLRPYPITSEELPGFSEAITKDGHIQTFPYMWSDWGGIDGFFSARWQRS